jgi:hypothetical protein
VGIVDTNQFPGSGALKSVGGPLVAKLHCMCDLRSSGRLMGMVHECA